MYTQRHTNTLVLYFHLFCSTSTYAHQPPLADGLATICLFFFSVFDNDHEVVEEILTDSM